MQPIKRIFVVAIIFLIISLSMFQAYFAEDLAQSKEKLRQNISFELSPGYLTKPQHSTRIDLENRENIIISVSEKSAALRRSVTTISTRPEVKKEKIARQLIIGTLSGVAGSLAGLAIIKIIGTSSDELPGWAGAAGYVTGAVTGVYISGCDAETKGSEFATTLGGILGGSSALLFWEHGEVALVTFLAATPLLATLGFQLTRSYRKPKTAGNALLQWNSGGVKAQMPAFDIVPDFRYLNRSFFQVKLVEIEL